MTESFRVGSMVLSADFIEDGQIATLLKGKDYEGWTGYLLSQGENERIKRQYRLNMFYESKTAWIQVREYSAAILEDSVKHLISMNSHAKYVEHKLGWDIHDDREIYIARLSFVFE